MVGSWQEGDPDGWWDETFKSHADSKPKGPEAISLDLSFPGASHVYGLPEHATSLSLDATAGTVLPTFPITMKIIVTLACANRQEQPANSSWRSCADNSISRYYD